ncbi:hypothetical protein [Knoellia koreensis]|uniref:Uncharacterized protein n=1 Tax=Knoellia koreensis TaxID=2730921 RepID=A0A849H400_9MICO|nr:hypothetical protein [Knoellia sp. DB2414S]NNM44520.1 hypothetical protein [Knoellia sp. DB2414S]
MTAFDRHTAEALDLVAAARQPRPLVSDPLAGRRDSRLAEIRDALLLAGLAVLALAAALLEEVAA